MNTSQKLRLSRIIVSGALFAASFFVPGGIWRLIICIAAFLLVGWDVLFDAACNIVHGQVFDEKFLMSVASLGAFAVGESHEAVFVMVFFQIGELFESIAVGKSRRSVAALMEIAPNYANIMRDGKLTEVPPEDVFPGDIIVVKPGERIPLDGVVTEGESSVNTSALTGEALPVDVSVGDALISGCVNIDGLLHVRVTKAFEDSTVAKILELVESSAASKSRSENFITRFARWYTPLVVVSALVLAVLPSVFFGNWTQWIHRALTFLVISCPCALVISVPLSYFGGIGRASREGILVKGSNYLDALAQCDEFVFDKTGTLTKGSFCVKAVFPQRCGESELAQLASCGEAFSDHPIARCIRSFYGKETDSARISDVEEKAGFGVIATVDGREVLVGGKRLMESRDISFSEIKEPGTHVYVAAGGEFIGAMLIADEIKEDARESIISLKKLGIKRTLILSGDSQASASDVASRLGIDEVYAGLMPADKLSHLEEILKKNKTGKTAYVGDGINDAPCLSRADLGIAMGALGSDAAIEAADVVLMDDKPSKLPLAISIARKTGRIVKQNIVFALGVKFGILILGALGYAGMWAAVFADVGVCVIAILNAMRTQR